MTDLWRWIMTRFGARYVVLTDHDGERTIRRVRWEAGRPIAYRFPLTGPICRLMDGGRIKGPSFVHQWEPYAPFQARQFPEAQQ